MDQIPPVLRLDGRWTNPWVLNRAESCLEKHRPAKIFWKNRYTHIIVAFTLIAITRRRFKTFCRKNFLPQVCQHIFCQRKVANFCISQRIPPCSPSAISFCFFNIHQSKPKYVRTIDASTEVSSSERGERGSRIYS